MNPDIIFNLDSVCKELVSLNKKDELTYEEITRIDDLLIDLKYLQCQMMENLDSVEACDE